MTSVGTGGIGTRFTRTEYPVEEGLTAGTQKQEGRQINLVPEQSFVLEEDRVDL